MWRREGGREGEVGAHHPKGCILVDGSRAERSHGEGRSSRLWDEGFRQDGSAKKR